MAVVLSPVASSWTGNSDASIQLFDVDLPSSSRSKGFRPTLADQQKIGFFSLDRTTQTDVTEILDVKELTDSVCQLLDDADTMRRDINFARSVMTADFEYKLQQKSIDMYVRVNEKVSVIEKQHKERVCTIRRAFKQQLSDAIARIHAVYNKDVACRLNREREKTDADAGKVEGKYKEMQAQLQRNESVIQMLQLQLEQSRAKEADEQVMIFENEADSVAGSVRTPSPDVALREENAELTRQVEKLEDRLAKLQREGGDRDGKVAQLGKQIDSLNDQLERERILMEQLKHEKDELLTMADQERSFHRRQAREMEEMAEGQLLEMEKQFGDQLKAAREQALADARLESEQMQNSHGQKLRSLMEENKELQHKLMEKEKEKKQKKIQKVDTDYHQRNEERLLAEISKLKKEIDRIHRAWEKKFAILQQSLHALKDESFVRHTMQRQAAQLHQAAISYSCDAPLGITPTLQKHLSSGGKKHPLPDIKSQRPTSPGADYISYTVSARSGRITNLFTFDEDQVMSDGDQDLPPGVEPLPSPPLREPTGDDVTHQAVASRPSTTKSHVVILPVTQGDV